MTPDGDSLRGQWHKNAIAKTGRDVSQDLDAGTSERSRSAEAWLMYDGCCPFCRRYVKYMRLRDAVGALDLVNARDGGPRVAEVLHAGLDLDEGLVLKLSGQYYQGADCLHVLALLSGESDWINRINAVIFRSPRLSRALYPVLRTGRNSILRMLGHSKIQSSDVGRGLNWRATSSAQDPNDKHRS